MYTQHASKHPLNTLYTPFIHHIYVLKQRTLQLIRASCDVEMGMNAVERILHYSDDRNIGAEQARHNVDMGTVVPEGWPRKGHIDIRGLQVRRRIIC